MIFLRYSNTFIEANCYIIADEGTREALVVDPGAGAAGWVRDTLAAQNLHLGAVLCTHGHGDHVWDSAAVAGKAPVYIPEPDLYRLKNPAGYTFGHVNMFVQYSGHEWERPIGAVALPDEFYDDDGAEIVQGITIAAIAAPGHSEGSCVFTLTGRIAPDPQAARTPEGSFGSALMLSGDVLFRDGVGRTDLPGSDPQAAMRSLRHLATVIPPATIFFPGHGPSSTMGRELRHSPFLKDALG
ncbi:MAG: MBL fold metallo-hydrolase [Ancrocorticia sp.]|uniref:MBL fold metallo-hydrolase n=1 Tax=Ancrocorticia sp. TaxID=2593684 RepID=UPI003F8ED62C